jgi:hypothetical protein
VLIVGLPRSGTSWVGNTLGRAPGAEYVHEPDGDHEPFAFRARRGSFIAPVLDPGTPAPELERLWAGVFAGGRRSTSWSSRLAWRLYRNSPVERRWRSWLEGETSPDLRLISHLARPLEAVPGARHVVAKTVRAEGYVEWIAQRFSPEVVIVERNPLNALASWSELGFGKDPRALVGLGRLARERWDVEVLPATAPLIERQAFVFGVGACLLRDATARHPEWTVVSHEVLCRDPKDEARALLARVGLEWGPGTERYLVESDREGTGYRTERRARDQPERWRSRLTEEQVDGILTTLARFPHSLVGS